MSSKEFEVGTSVEAFWYPDKCWYTAKILMKTGKGYEVKYDVDKFVKDLPLKEAMSMNLNQRLVDCATALQDIQLLAMLSSGDVITQEMKYQPSCPAAVYNKERQKRQTDIESSCTQEETIMKETALAENSEESVVFRLADLANLYAERLAQIGSSSAQVHFTRLKDKLLQKKPELEAHLKGRDVLLMFEKDIAPAIAFACDYNDTMPMAKTAEMIRCQLATTKTTFSESLVSDDIDDSIPHPLLQLVKMNMDLISNRS
ncbi:Hypothetical predicted protein [Mytilus galloprovincialis]|uniref:Tudor domain-containing protein n=1 Tax=Mytilus galloprovincialis TaxID=29158 RepID=A0A8B6CUA8_MYTGA|nr:Hypothetical predicted protein [Mytilus galloprovincialis]